MKAQKKNSRSDQLTPRKLLLIDGIGALLSAFLIGVVLVQFESTFGMPTNVLYPLAIGACGFAVYSFTAFFLSTSNPKPYLRFIAVVNLLYCLVTAVLVFYFFEKITTLGLVYFGAEILVILTLVRIEFKVTIRES